MHAYNNILLQTQLKHSHKSTSSKVLPNLLNDYISNVNINWQFSALLCKIHLPSHQMGVGIILLQFYIYIVFVQCNII